MQIAQNPSFLNAIGQVLNPVQGVKPAQTQPSDKTNKQNVVAANEDGKAGQTQSAPPTSSTRRGSSVNLLV